MKILDITCKGNDLYAIRYYRFLREPITRYAIYREGFKVSKESEPIFAGFVFTDDGTQVFNSEGKDVLEWMRKNKITYHSAVNGETIGGEP